MSQPGIPQARYGRERLCPHCGTRVAQKALACFFCGASLDSAPRHRLRVPWADLFLFAAIGAVLALWWLQAPASPSGERIAQLEAGAMPIYLAATTAPLTVLPADDLAPTPTPLPPTPTPSATLEPTPTVLAAPIRYVVKAGDTVVAIAGLYATTAQAIIQANGLRADGRLQVGQELVVPVTGPVGGPGPTATPKSGALIYTVQPGDTISDIALRLGSRIDWILTANKMKPTDFLRIGQSLLVPLAATTATPTATPIPVSPTPTATPQQPYGSPILLSPPDGSVLSGQREVLLSWTSVGTLGKDRWYVVILRSDALETAPITWWTKETTWRLPAQYRGTADAGIDFTWRVQVRTGTAANPGRAASPPSQERRFTWD